MISASHNPYERQRRQVLLGARREAARCLGRAGRAGADSSRCSRSIRRISAGRGAPATRAAATSSSARARSAASLSLKGLKIVIDAANGAALYNVAPEGIPRTRRRGPCRSAAARTAPTSTPASARPRRRRWSQAVAEHGARLRRRPRRRRRPPATGRPAAGRLYNGDELLYLLVCRPSRPGGAGRRERSAP